MLVFPNDLTTLGAEAAWVPKSLGRQDAVDLLLPRMASFPLLALLATSLGPGW